MPILLFFPFRSLLTIRLFLPCLFLGMTSGLIVFIYLVGASAPVIANQPAALAFLAANGLPVVRATTVWAFDKPVAVGDETAVVHPAVPRPWIGHG